MTCRAVCCAAVQYLNSGVVAPGSNSALVTLSLNDQPLSADSINVLAKILSDPDAPARPLGALGMEVAGSNLC